MKISEKPFCLDYAHGLHCESAHFDTIREAMDAAEGLLSDFLEAIDADWLSEDQRWIIHMMREEREASRIEPWTDEETDEFLDRLHAHARARYVQQASEAASPIADPQKHDERPPTVDIKITTRTPLKWRFHDLETGEVWLYRDDGFVEANDPPAAEYQIVWAELTGYVQEAARDGDQIDAAEMLAHLAELRHKALLPVRDWMRSLGATPPDERNT